MNDIIKDINNPNWWFNFFVGVVIISLGYVITEFVIKPIGLSTKNHKGHRGQTENSEVADANTILQIKENEREEMRLRFDLASIQRTIFIRLMMLILIISATGCFLIIESFPIKIALIGFGLWKLFSTLRQLAQLFRYQHYHVDILERVRKD